MVTDLTVQPSRHRKTIRVAQLLRCIRPVEVNLLSGRVGEHQTLSCLDEPEVGVQIAAQVMTVLFRGPHHPKLTGRDDHAGWKGPFKGQGAIVAQEISPEVFRSRSGIVELDEVGSVTVVVTKSCRADGHEFGDENVLSARHNRAGDHEKHDRADL